MASTLPTPLAEWPTDEYPAVHRAPLSAILAPRAIAVIGASRRADSIGHQVLHNLIAFGFTGSVHPVNPRASSLCSIRALPSIADAPEPIDVAVIAVPKERVLDVAAECGAAGVRGLVVITAGFREVGGEGAAREEELVAIVRRHGMRMVGPNCMGVMNADPAVSMNATFATVMPPFGHAAFVSQSGALGLSVLDYARELGIGISQFVSVGNKADVSGNDLLLAWEIDPSVGVILMYVENFGHPRRFLEIASRITRTKPIIVVKSGRSRAGARAASSHTGALAASDTTVDALLSQAGVLRATTVEELFDMAMAFEVRSLPRSRRTAVLTNAGGPGILAADALESQGLDLVDLSPETVDRLRPLFPAEASIRNPLDMIASATPAGYQAAMSALLADPAVDAVVPIFVPPFGVRQEDVAAAIVGAAATTPDKTVLAVLMGREGLPAGRAELNQAGIPAYIFPESAAHAMATLHRHVAWAAEPLAESQPVTGVDEDAIRAIIEGARGESREHLTPLEAMEVIRACGIPIAASRLASTVDAAVEAARELGYPIALKVASRDVVHKTDVGGVVLDVASEAELVTEMEALLARVASRVPGARVDGVLLQSMVPKGIETIAGVSSDPSFGPLVMFGLGGIFVETMRDVVFRMAPVDDREAHRMVRAIRGARLFDGVRGAPPTDVAALADAIRRLSHLAAVMPEIIELDVNPLMGHEHGAVAADARVRIALT